MKKFSGEMLETARGRRTQTDLAMALRRRGFGTTQTQVSRWESGQEPRLYIREALAAELGVRLDDLYIEVPEADAPFHGRAA